MERINKKILFITALLFLVCASPSLAQKPNFDNVVKSYAAKGEGLIAGAAVMDITPKRAYTDSIYIAGFMQGRKSSGVRDPITARALFLFDGKTPLVLVTLDLVGYSYDAVVNIRDKVSRTYGENIIIISVHNHEGPDIVGYWGAGIFIPFMSGVDKKYNESLKKKIARVIFEAASNARPARLRFGSVMVPNDLCAQLWGPPDQQDHEMSVMNVEDTDGKPIAALINYGCHAEAMEEFNNKISADWPGKLYKAWEEKHGGIAMFVSGAAAGMITPRAITGSWGPVKRMVAFAERMGKAYAESAASAIEGSSPVGPKGIRISLDKKIVDFPLKNWRFEYAFKQGILTREQADPETLNIKAEVDAFTIGPARFVTAPGELFPSLAFEIKGLIKEKYKFILTLANDELGYIMTKDQFSDKTYEYEQSMSLGVNTGPIVMDAIKALLGGQQGE